MSKVQTVEAIPVSYPEPNDFNALRHLCLVKITTDDGVVGWGESITQFPEANFAAKAIIEGMAERVVGKDPLDNDRIWHRCATRRGGTATTAASPRYAVAAIDIALWDIKGKLLGDQRARPARRRGPREAAGDRLLPRPLRGHRRGWWRRPRSGSRPGCTGVKVGFGKRGNARLGYEHDRDVEYMRRCARGSGPTRCS